MGSQVDFGLVRGSDSVPFIEEAVVHKALGLPALPVEVGGPRHQAPPSTGYQLTVGGAYQEKEEGQGDVAGDVVMSLPVHTGIDITMLGTFGRCFGI